jgi:hypothetical protein
VPHARSHARTCPGPAALRPNVPPRPSRRAGIRGAAISRADAPLGGTRNPGGCGGCGGLRGYRCRSPAPRSDAVYPGLRRLPLALGTAISAPPRRRSAQAPHRPRADGPVRAGDAGSPPSEPGPAAGCRDVRARGRARRAIGLAASPGGLGPERPHRPASRLVTARPQRRAPPRSTRRRYPKAARAAVPPAARRR